MPGKFKENRARVFSAVFSGTSGTWSEGNQVLSGPLGVEGQLIGVPQQGGRIVSIPWEGGKSGGDAQAARGIDPELGESKVADLGLEAMGDLFNRIGR